MGAGFPAAVAMRVTGVPSFDTLDYWCTSGLVSASEMPPGGRRRFSLRDLVTIKVIVGFRTAGIPLQSIRKVADRLREAHGLDLAGSRLVVVGDDVLLVASDDELINVLRRPGQTAMAFLVDLGRVEAEVREGVERLKAA